MQLMSDSNETVLYNESLSASEEEPTPQKETLMSDSDETVPYNESSLSEDETFSTKMTALKETKSGRVVRLPYRYR